MQVLHKDLITLAPNGSQIIHVGGGVISDPALIDVTLREGGQLTNTQGAFGASHGVEFNAVFTEVAQNPSMYDLDLTVVSVDGKAHNVSPLVVHL